MISKQLLENFNPTEEQIKNTEMVFLKMAEVETVKPIIKKLQSEVLDKHKFRDDEGNIITTEQRTYLMKDSDFKIYLEEMHKKHLEAGFNVKKDYCPLLIAESNLIDAKRKFIDSMSSLTGIKWSDITRLEHYERLVDLNLKFMVKFIHDKEQILKNYTETGYTKHSINGVLVMESRHVSIDEVEQ